MADVLIPAKIDLPVVGNTSTVVLAGVAGFIVGMWLLSGSNCYAQGKWGAKTFGWFYAKGLSLSPPLSSAAGSYVQTGN